MKLYCSKCRSALAHAIGRGKNSKDDYKDVSVVRKIKEGLHECVCNRCVGADPILTTCTD